MHQLLAPERRHAPPPRIPQARRADVHPSPHAASAALAYARPAGALSVSRPGDADEVEADRMATHVLSGAPGPVEVRGGSGEPGRVRRCARCSSGAPLCPECRARAEREAQAHGAGAGTVDAALSSPGEPLDAGTRGWFEMRFGRPLDGVRVHADGPAARSADAVGALAYTVGSHVAFAQGRYAPETGAGRALLAHELAHVVQNQAGGGPARLRRQTPPAPEPAPEPPDPEVERLSAALCIGDDRRTGPAEVPFTPRERSRITALRFAASGLASRAAMNASRPDPRMAQLARRIFHVTDVDMTRMATTVVSVGNAVRSLPIVQGTCADEVCAGAPAAYVPDDLSRIIICPFFWTLGLVQQRRTLLHEAAHAVGIDAATPYVHPPNCSEEEAVMCGPDACPGVSDLRAVDAWARYIECAALSA